MIRIYTGNFTYDMNLRCGRIENAGEGHIIVKEHKIYIRPSVDKWQLKGILSYLQSEYKPLEEDCEVIDALLDLGVTRLECERFTFSKAADWIKYERNKPDPESEKHLDIKEPYSHERNGGLTSSRRRYVY